MNEYHFGSGATSRKHSAPRKFGGKIQYLLSAEEQLLQSISARAPLPELLNKICSTLDCDIGNMVSLISLRNGGATNLAEVARDAKHFGLYAFCSASVIGENEELLGSLEMYCCVPHRPSFCELQLIERAACLAAIAIKRCTEAGHANHCVHVHLPVPADFLEWPSSMN